MGLEEMIRGWISTTEVAVLMMIFKHFIRLKKKFFGDERLNNNSLFCVFVMSLIEKLNNYVIVLHSYYLFIWQLLFFNLIEKIGHIG